MKALVYTGPLAMELRDVAEPQANEDVIVRVAACGICGSDMHAYHGHDERRPPPLILGHEAAGTAASGAFAGRRVAINPLVSCMSCDVCLDGRQHLCGKRVIISMPARPGCLAEQVRVPERNLVAIPEGMEVALAALAEPMAVAYHAVSLGERALAKPLAAADIAVLGGGAIGLGTAQVLESRGGRGIRIAETAANRRARLEKAGRFLPYDPVGPSALAAASVDLVLDAFGGKASRAEACRIVRPGGVIVHIGLASGTEGVDVRRLTLQEVTFIGSYCYTMVEYRETLAGLASGRFGALDWIEERPLAEGVRAFRDLHEGRVAAGKIVLRM
jgi:L-iditol 2-dehydrogenase